MLWAQAYTGSLPIKDRIMTFKVLQGRWF